MNNREILKAVLEKAINQGFVVNQASFDYLMNVVRQNDGLSKTALDYYIKEKKYYDTIFSHKFAKSFFGNEIICMSCNQKNKSDYCNNCKTSFHTDVEWAAHLQQMVLEEEPLKYLEKFL